MPAAVIPITQGQSAPTFMPPKNWGFSQASYAFKATKMVGSDRCRELERRGSYFDCTNHEAPGPMWHSTQETREWGESL